MKPGKIDPAQARRYFSDKLAFTTGPAELDRWLKEGEPLTIVDVRRAEDYAKGHIPGALNLPRETWTAPTGLSKDKNNVVYCYSQPCHLAAEAASQFAGQGYPVMELEGGFDAWQKYGLKVEAREVAGVR